MASPTKSMISETVVVDIQFEAEAVVDLQALCEVCFSLTDTPITGLCPINSDTYNYMGSLYLWEYTHFWLPEAVGGGV